MKRRSRWTLAATAAERWKEAYLGWNGIWGCVAAEITHRRLLELGPNPNPDDVASLLNTNSWTHVGECHECRQSAEELVEFSHDWLTWNLCNRCLLASLQLLEE